MRINTLRFDKILELIDIFRQRKVQHFDSKLQLKLKIDKKKVCGKNERGEREKNETS